MNPTEKSELVWELRPDCEDLQGGVSPHAHCVHGHARYCPDPGECELVWPPGFPRVGFASDRKADWDELLETLKSRQAAREAEVARR